MKTENTYMGSVAILKHISGIKAETYDSVKNGDNSSGHGNTSCIFIFMKDKFISGLNAVIKALTEFSFKSKKGGIKFSRRSFLKGREMYMLTGNSSYFFRISSGSSGKISGFFKRISDELISFCKSVRGFTKSLRRISIHGKSFPGIHRIYSRSVRENCGIFIQLPESLRVSSVMTAYIFRSYRFLYYLFLCFPGLFRSLPEESVGEQMTIKNRFINQN